MNFKLLLLQLSIVLMAFSSCNQGEKKKVKMIEGQWEISTFQKDYYTNNVVDSSAVQTNCGTITFWYEKEYGDFVIYFSTEANWQEAPAFAALGTDRILSDPFLDSRMVFSSIGGGRSVAYSTLELSKKKIKMFVFMFRGDGSFQSKETIELRAYN